MYPGANPSLSASAHQAVEEPIERALLLKSLGHAVSIYKDDRD